MDFSKCPARNEISDALDLLEHDANGCDVCLAEDGEVFVKGKYILFQLIIEIIYKNFLEDVSQTREQVISAHASIVLERHGTERGTKRKFENKSEDIDLLAIPFKKAMHVIKRQENLASK